MNHASVVEAYKLQIYYLVKIWFYYFVVGVHCIHFDTLITCYVVHVTKMNKDYFTLKLVLYISDLKF